MLILGIETSCDETSAAVIKTSIKNQVKLISNVVASSMSLHKQTGGIIPEIAAREQIKYIIPVIDEALKGVKRPQVDIDAIAVTVGPGLIGSLLVGVETAKTLSWIWNKPIIPVNHLIGHIYANFLMPGAAEIEFPALALIVSGGHTDLVLLKNHNNIKWISGTRDDAAGEAFDKIGRLLGLPYPAGPDIEILAKEGNPKRFHFPRPLLHEKTLDFSFSGLKTAVLREVQKITLNLAGSRLYLDPKHFHKSSHIKNSGMLKETYGAEYNSAPASELNAQTVCDLARATQDAIIEVLVTKTIRAAEEYNVKSILLGGGVAANETLRNEFMVNSSRFMVKFFAPAKNLCTDNAAMIAAAAFFNYKEVPWRKITANPELYFD